MSRTASRVHTILLLPLVLLTVNLFEEVGWAVMRTHVSPASWRVALRVVLEGAVFAIAAKELEPFLRGLFGDARSGVKRKVGSLGPVLFYGAAYAAVYAAYFVLETRGPRALVP